MVFMKENTQILIKAIKISSDDEFICFYSGNDKIAEFDKKQIIGFARLEDNIMGPIDKLIVK